LLAIEFSGECAGDMDQAGTFFPAAATLFKLTGPEILWVAALAFQAMATVKFQRHTSTV
jgi:hypothetical protein